MSIRKDLDSAKQEFANDEKMLESVFKLEAIFKKYKLVFLSVLALVVIVPMGFWVKDYLQEQKALKITALFNQYQKDSNTQTLEGIKNQSPELYELIALSSALKAQDLKLLEQMAQSQNPFIAQYAKYQVASLTQNFSNNPKMGDFSNLALIQEGYLQAIAKNHAQAMQFLNQISPSSDLREWALRIGHYGITR